MNIATLFDLSGKTALVTGGNSGIGEALARALGLAGRAWRWSPDARMLWRKPPRACALRALLPTFWPRIFPCRKKPWPAAGRPWKHSAG